MPKFQDVRSGSTFIHPHPPGKECIKLLMHADLVIEDITLLDCDEEEDEGLISTIGVPCLRHCFVFRSDLKTHGMSDCYIYILHPEQNVELPE